MNTGSLPGNTEKNGKAKPAASQPNGLPAASKETIATDLTTVLSIPGADATAPLSVFLSLPLMAHPATGYVEAGKTALPGDLLAAQLVPAPATDAPKASPAITSSLVIAAAGKNTVPVLTPGKIQPEQPAAKTASDKSETEPVSSGDKMLPLEAQKISTALIATAALPPVANASQPVTNTKTVPSSIDAKTALSSIDATTILPLTDAKTTLPLTATKTVLPPTDAGTAQPPADAKTVLSSIDARTVLPLTGDIGTPTNPINGEKPAVIHLKQEGLDLTASLPAGSDDKFQAVPPVATKPPAGPSMNDGTGVAITASSMKNSDKTNKVAGLGVQDLPGGTNGTARETVLPARATVTAVSSSEKQNSDINLPLPAANPAPVDVAETASIVALPALGDARMRDIERTHDLVSIHALRMVDAKSDSLQVVIKPCAGTELSLELRHRNGTVEAEAVLQHGDFQLMNQHWPELQSKLEQRGIKLAPLGGETNFSAATGNNSNTGNFSRQQSSREEAASQASAFAEFTVAMNRGGATARLAPVTAGGWESWA
ncbi:MAG: hypothetical protein P4N60_18885 [Verrucomicrobiae bacterium]|nr:hypothetical protein [Verrucomicrobiae bacterium]